MKDYNKENEIRILEEIKTFCESMISLNSTDKRSEKIEAFFEEMKKKNVPSYKEFFSSSSFA